MKILYSQLKTMVPDLTVESKKLAYDLTLIGFMSDSLIEVNYQGKKDWLIGLEIRQNRPDCLGYLGIAREVSAYYGLPIIWPTWRNQVDQKAEKLNIEIKTDKVKRVMATKIVGLRNEPSPVWLKEFLAFYDLNSINLLVDLSNYVMLLTGFPSHLLDFKKITGALNWSINDNFEKIMTLDGSEINLKKNELIIADEKNILALAGLVGGQVAMINDQTTEIIVEMALYDHALIGKNSRSLGIMTEAGNRLSKELSPAELDQAFGFLVSLIIEHGHGKVVGEIFEHYPEPVEAKIIAFNHDRPSQIAGIKIDGEMALKILQKLRCQIVDFGDEHQTDISIKIKTPIDRTDLNLEADLVEEVIRLHGYDQIPKTETPSLDVTPNITPKLFKLKEKISDLLVANGYDEVMAQPLVAEKANQQVNYLDWQMITTQNSVNDEFPCLRQSLTSGLVEQLQEYGRNNLDEVRIFEIGKVFGLAGDDYQEHDALAMLWQASVNQLNQFRCQLENVLANLGFNLSYQQAKKNPELANPNVCYDILVDNQVIGVIYKAKPLGCVGEVYLAEINLESLLTAKTETKLAVAELDQKLVFLDINLTVYNSSELPKIIDELTKKIPAQNLWQIKIIDQFKTETGWRYTARIYYYNLSDQEAKIIHAKLI